MSRYFERLIKALDLATSTDETRGSLMTIGVLSTTPNTPATETMAEKFDGKSRLVATNGHIVVVCDVNTEDLDFACSMRPPLLYKILGDKGEIAYVTPKKNYLDKNSVFPYPMIRNIFSSGIQTIEGNIPVYFNVELQALYCLIRDAYLGNRPKTTTHFSPTHENSNLPTSMKMHCDPGLVIGLMPLRMDNTLAGYVPNLEFDAYLPGFLNG
jgi:hypothetical protein